MERAEQTHTDWFERTEVFREDFNHTARLCLRMMFVFLAIFVFMIYKIWALEPPAQDTINTFAAIFALCSLGPIAVMRRLRRIKPVLIIGPNGVAFPHAGITAIDWCKVQKVECFRMNARGMYMYIIRFHFSSGTLNRRQFGSITKDRWEVTVSMRAYLFGWEYLRIAGGYEAVLKSIERYARVKQK